MPLDDVLARLRDAGVPASRVYTIAEIAADPHYAARGNIERIPAMAGGTIAAPGIVPKLSDTPGAGAPRRADGWASTPTRCWRRRGLSRRAHRRRCAGDGVIE